MRVSGLGFVNALYCPHYDKEQRAAPLSRMIARRGGIGIACDNNAAIEIVGESYRVITSAENAKAYKVFKRKRRAVVAEVPRSDGYTPLGELLTRR